MSVIDSLKSTLWGFTPLPSLSIPKNKTVADTKKITLPPIKDDGAVGAVTVEPESFAGQLGKGVGQGVKVLMIVGVVGAVLVFFGPQLAAMLFKNSVSAAASVRRG
jgi:hypothetical protein